MASSDSPIDHRQWSFSRFAFLFLPGTCDVDVSLCCYTPVLGLERFPSNVVFDAVKSFDCVLA